MSGMDLTHAVDVQLVDPSTGELLTLDATTDLLGEFLDHVRDVEAQLREQKRAVSRELHARMDREGLWTVRLPGLTVSGQSPARVEYDGDQLHDALEQLVAADLISETASLAACESVTEWKPKVAGINRLIKLGGRVAELVKACAADVPPESRRITIKRTAA